MTAGSVLLQSKAVVEWTNSELEHSQSKHLREALWQMKLLTIILLLLLYKYTVARQSVSVGLVLWNAGNIHDDLRDAADDDVGDDHV
jgi:hypothetical protein